MKSLSLICSLAGFMLLCAGFVSSQEKGFKKNKRNNGMQEEDARMMKILERSLKLADTERDRFIRELVRIDPKDALRVDFKQWYTRLAGGGPNWERAKADRQSIRELFERVAMRMKIEGDTITRDQFLVYANRYLGSENSPYWREPNDNAPSREVNVVFEYFDRDRDQFLKGDEMPPALQADLPRWDKNGDQKIDSEEYLAYFRDRFNQLRQQVLKTGLAQEPGETNDPATGVAPPKLPPGLPKWFVEVDRDRDGQIALFEWRKANWPIEEFASLDLNDDGFLVPDEVLRLLATINRDGTQPYEYLMKKTTGKTTSGLTKKGPR